MLLLRVFIWNDNYAEITTKLTMDFEYIVYTPMMDIEEFLTEVDLVISVLKDNKVSDIEMYFGFSWGSWESFYSNVLEIKSEIKKQEQITGDSFGENDVYVVINELETEIVFCHEADIHIEFNRVNKVVSDILNNWNDRGIIHCIRKNKVDIEFDMLPL